MEGACSMNEIREIRTTFLSKKAETSVGSRELDSSGSGEEPVAGSCEHGNELSSPTKCGEFLD
jgi:hypothetical protein